MSPEESGEGVVWILESREKCDRRVKSVHSMPCFLSRCDVDFYARVCEDIQLALHHRSHVYCIIEGWSGRRVREVRGISESVVNIIAGEDE